MAVYPKIFRYDSFWFFTEGITDQEIISNILFGYFENPNLIINELQPLRDETDRNKSSYFGGWGNLIEYCKSEIFKYAFQSVDYVIIQIDTDVCEDYHISKRENGKELNPEQLIEKVINIFIEIIGNDFYKLIEQRIIFAVSVHSIECWLLPVYYTDSKKSKTVNCLQTLNQALQKKGFTIDKNNKNFEYYREISEVFIKKKKLNQYYSQNPSFEIFIKNLDFLFC